MISLGLPSRLLKVRSEPAAELHDGDMAAVMRGMELMRWRYEREEWRDYVERLVSAARVRQSWARPSARVTRLLARVAQIGLILVILISLGAVAGVMRGGAVTTWITMPMWVVGGAFLALAAPFAPHLVRHAAYRGQIEELHQEGNLPAPAVTLTATGLLIGDVARVWRGPRYRLVEARVDDESEPTLTVIFERRGWLRRTRRGLCLPVPPGLVPDVRRLAATLRERRSAEARELAASMPAPPTR